MEEQDIPDRQEGLLYTDLITAAHGTARFRFRATLPVVYSFENDLLDVLSRGRQEVNNLGHPLLRNTPAVRDGIARLAANWKTHAPGVQGLHAFLRTLQPDEPFYALGGNLNDRAWRRDLQIHLRALTSGREFSAVKAELMEVFGDLLEHYQIGGHGDRPEAIGEPDRQRRICRFCGRGAPHVSFKRRAHAISEFLGNKVVVLHDECDTCNTRFGQGIERSLANYIAPFRTFLGIKGKGGLKTMKGRDFDVRRQDGQVFVELRGQVQPPATGSKEYPIELATDDPIAWQDIYRTLCKYFLSVIPDEDLARFKGTLAWVNGAAPPSSLPLVGVAVDYQRFCETAELTTYLRRSDDRSLPHAIGELRYACLSFFFIVPFTGEEDHTFNEPDDRQCYWPLFKHLHRVPGWSFTDFSDPKARKVTWKLVARVQPRVEEDEQTLGAVKPTSMAYEEHPPPRTP